MMILSRKMTRRLNAVLAGFAIGLGLFVGY